jgi:UDP-N-acetylmuramoyl-L-alanyl-D-glutamate--2,6-diaminopimelate ligase
MRPKTKVRKSLKEIADFLGISLIDLAAAANISITGITHASSQVTGGDLFLAFPGANVHGAHFALDAQQRGARAVLTDQAGADLTLEMPTLIVGKARKTAGLVSAWFYGEPMQDMYCVGVTGTNGKTTTTTLLSQLWMGAGRECGLIGTIETRIGEQIRPSQRTTPESCELQELARTVCDQGIQNFVMEVSSHALSLERLRGSHFAAVAFTNLTQDHLDFHGSMESYYSAKAKLFSYEYAEKAFINIDDPYGERLSSETELPIIRLSRSSPTADWYFDSTEILSGGMQVAIRGPGGILIEGFLPLHGGYNLDNSLMAIALAFDSGVDPIDIAALMPNLWGARGRLEVVNVGQEFSAFVDYAHSPDAVSRVLQTCRGMAKGRVIAVLGCGGDRDSSKRVLMGQALLSESDIAVFTSDNPRSEVPENILADMTHGLVIDDPCKMIVDRSAAIKYAVGLAEPEDLVIILGKGHELGQEIAGEVLPFDDRKVLITAIEGR